MAGGAEAPACTAGTDAPGGTGCAAQAVAVDVQFCAHAFGRGGRAMQSEPVARFFGGETVGKDAG